METQSAKKNLSITDTLTNMVWDFIKFVLFWLIMAAAASAVIVLIFPYPVLDWSYSLVFKWSYWSVMLVYMIIHFGLNLSAIPWLKFYERQRLTGKTHIEAFNLACDKVKFRPPSWFLETFFAEEL